VDAPDAGVLRGPRRDRRLSGPRRARQDVPEAQERQIGRLATLSGGRGNTSDLHLWTGVRRQESERRMANVTPEQDGPRWTWHAPIHDWSKQDCREYVDRFDLPQNDLWDDLRRSGDCFCGCFGSPGKIDLEAAGHVDHADWLRNLERDADADDERGRWAWGALTDAEARAGAYRRRTDDALLNVRRGPRTEVSRNELSNCDGEVVRRDAETDREYRLRWELSNCPEHDLPARLRGDERVQ